MNTVTGKEITVPVSFRLALPQYQALVDLARKQADGNLSKTARLFVLRGMQEAVGQQTTAPAEG